MKALLTTLGLLLLPGLLQAQISAHSAVPAPAEAFQGSTDIGKPLRGYTEFDPLQRSYRVAGGGEDVWGTADSFRYVWTRVSGDASLSARVHIDAPVTYRLSKGMLMFRQSLDPDSPYADLAIHADGHITLQYRLRPGGETRDLLLPASNVQELRLERQGDRFVAYVGKAERNAKPVSISIPLGDPVYVGLGVCSHNTDVLQNVTFSDLNLAGRVQ